MSHRCVAGDSPISLALPAACPGCGAEGPPLCDRCVPRINTRLDLPPGTPLGLADGPPDPLLQLEWCAPFAGTARRAIHVLKYDGERRLAEPLGEAVAARWRRAGAGGDLVVAVPVHDTRRRERGFDQAELIARVAARRLGLPMQPALVRHRVTAPQFRLDRRHRAANMADAFVPATGPPGRVAGRWVVLVDDIFTTGSTLCSAARTLLDAGAAAVSAVTVARER